MVADGSWVRVGLGFRSRSVLHEFWLVRDGGWVGVRDVVGVSGRVFQALVCEAGVLRAQARV